MRALRYNDCDFEFEALAPAMYGWAVAEFGLTVPQVEVAFGGRERRYVFNHYRDNGDDHGPGGGGALAEASDAGTG